MKNSYIKIQNILHSEGVDAQVIEFSEMTKTSAQAAEAIGCSMAQIAKTIIFKTKKLEKIICVIASGVNRVDEKKIEEFLSEKVLKPDAGFVLQHIGFPIGGVPPIGYKLDIPPFVDEDLMNYEKVWASAGTPYSVFEISPKELLRITHGQLVNIKK